MSVCGGVSVCECGCVDEWVCGCGCDFTEFCILVNAFFFWGGGGEGIRKL